MSALADRIAEVVTLHSAVPHGNYWRCSYPCPWHYGTRPDHAAHVAERIEAELGFTEETKHLEDGSGGISTNWKTGVTTSHSRPATKVRRWVSAWSVVPR